MTQVFCANCGQALRPTDKFCYNCGAKVVPIKMAPKVEAEAPKPEIINRVPKRPEPAPAKVQEEKPRFHMDESMSWNTDGYPEPKKRSSEEPDFSWADSSAQDRIKKRQEEGRKALYEEQAAREAAKQKAREEAEKQFAEPPEAEEVVKAVEAESIMPASELSLDDVPEELKPVEEVQTAAETPVEAPVVQEAPVEVPEATVVAPEPEVMQPEPAEPQEVPAAKVPGFTPAPEEEYEGYDEVPTIESIERAAAEEQARQTEKDIFGYTLDDVDAREKEGQNQVADKFYTYSKKNEEFQELLDQENDKLKTNRPVEAPVQEAPEMPEPTEVENDIPEGPIETGGFVGVQLPETPMEADAAKAEPETIELEKPEETSEFLDGNFGKEEQEKEEEGKSGRTVAAAAGAVAAGAAAIAAVAEKAKAAKAQAEQKAQEAQDTVEEKLDAATDKAYDDLDELARKADEAKEKVEAKASDAVDKVDEKLDSVQEKVEEVKTEASDEFAAFAPKVEDVQEKAEGKVEEVKEEVSDEFAAFAPKVEAAQEKAEAKAEEVKEAAEEKVEEVKTAVEEKPAEPKEPASGNIFTIPAYNAEEVKETASERAVKIDDEAEAKAEAVKEPVTDSFDQVKEKVEEVKEETEEVKEEVKEEAEDDHKLTYQEVFNNEAEKTQKHTFLKIIAILILLLIILEVVAILIRRFAPDSPAGVQIQQIYEMLFSRFTGR